VKTAGAEDAEDEASDGVEAAEGAGESDDEDER
jgi:hypothetical protein